jgi:hypothetical protein
VGVRLSRAGLSTRISKTSKFKSPRLRRLHRRHLARRRAHPRQHRRERRRLPFLHHWRQPLRRPLRRRRLPTLRSRQLFPMPASLPATDEWRLVNQLDAPRSALAVSAAAPFERDRVSGRELAKRDSGAVDGVENEAEPLTGYGSLNETGSTATKATLPIPSITTGSNSHCRTASSAASSSRAIERRTLASVTRPVASIFAFTRTTPSTFAARAAVG